MAEMVAHNVSRNNLNTTLLAIDILDVFLYCIRKIICEIPYLVIISISLLCTIQDHGICSQMHIQPQQLNY